MARGTAHRLLIDALPTYCHIAGLAPRALQCHIIVHGTVVSHALRASLDRFVARKALLALIVVRLKAISGLAGGLVEPEPRITETALSADIVV